MKAGQKVEIIAIIGEPVLRAALAASIPRYLGPDVVFYEAWPEIVPKSAIAIFDHWGQKGGLAPDTLGLLIGPESEARDLPPQNIFALPLRLGSLLDRINRSRTQGARAAIVAFGPYILDAGETVLRRAGREDPVRLTEKERDILLMLHEHGGEVGRQLLLEAIWGYGAAIETHTLETHIYRLRQKIEDNPAAPVYLLTEGAGYRLSV